MISEGSCDTKDWRNDAENAALITAINYILLYICIENIEGTNRPTVYDQKKGIMKTVHILHY